MIYLMSLIALIFVVCMPLLVKREAESWLDYKLDWYETFIFVVAFMFLLLISINPNREDLDYYD